MKKLAYVVRGALMMCSLGTHNRRINLPISHGVYINQKPIMLKSDYKTEMTSGLNNNIPYFGICTKADPKNQVTITLADQNTKLPIIGVKCTPMCVLHWIDCKKDVFVKENVLTIKSKLYCLSGGVISFLTDGQEYEEERKYIQEQSIVEKNDEELDTKEELKEGPKYWKEELFRNIDNRLDEENISEMDSNDYDVDKVIDIMVDELKNIKSKYRSVYEHSNVNFWNTDYNKEIADSLRPIYEMEDEENLFFKGFCEGSNVALESKGRSRLISDVIEIYKVIKGDREQKSEEESVESLLDKDGKFIDDDLQLKYEAYCKKKEDSDQTPRKALEWKAARDFWEEKKEQGRVFESECFQKFQEEYPEAVREITINTTEGTKIRVDAIALEELEHQNEEGFMYDVIIQEYKSSEMAPFTKNQIKGFPELRDSGGKVVGVGKRSFNEGFEIPKGTRVEVVRPDSKRYFDEEDDFKE